MATNLDLLAPSAAQQGSSLSKATAGEADQELSMRLAASVAAAQLPDGNADSTDAADGISLGAQHQAQRRLLSAAAEQGHANATADEQSVERDVTSRAKLQQSSSCADGRRQLDLTAYQRGHDAAHKRRGVSGTDPTICSLQCSAADEGALNKVRRATCLPKS